MFHTQVHFNDNLAGNRDATLAAKPGLSTRRRALGDITNNGAGGAGGAGGLKNKGLGGAPSLTKGQENHTVLRSGKSLTKQSTQLQQKPAERSLIPLPDNRYADDDDVHPVSDLTSDIIANINLAHSLRAYHTRTKEEQLSLDIDMSAMDELFPASSAATASSAAAKLIPKRGLTQRTNASVLSTPAGKLGLKPSIKALATPAASHTTAGGLNTVAKRSLNAPYSVKRAPSAPTPARSVSEASRQSSKADHDEAMAAVGTLQFDDLDMDALLADNTGVGAGLDLDSKGLFEGLDLDIALPEGLEF
jgi:hypothetical protein